MGRLQDFREQYPQYADLDDEQLGQALHKKYYAELEPEAFRSQVGLPPLPKEPEPPSFTDRVNQSIRTAAKKVRDVFSDDEEDLEEFVLEEGEGQSPIYGGKFSGFGDRSAPSGRETREERPPLLRDQFFAGWDQYRANRANMKAFGAIQDLMSAEDTATGGAPSGADSLQAGTSRQAPYGQMIRLFRTARAEEGDPQAQSELVAEVESRRETAVETLQQMIDRHAELSGRAATVPFSGASQRVMDAKTFGEGFNAVLDDPVRVIAEISIRSAPNMAEALPLAIAGSIAGPWGFAAGMGAGSAMTEYRNAFGEALELQGVDLSDARAMIAAAEDPEVMAKVRDYAAKRGGAIGAFDFVSAGLASRVLTPFVKHAFGRELANMAAQSTVQSATGAAGEASAQLLTTGQIEPGQILAEALGEAGTAPIDVGAATVSGMRAQRLQARAAQIEAELNEFMGGDVSRGTTEDPDAGPEIPPSPTPPPEPGPEPTQDPTEEPAPGGAPQPETAPEGDAAPEGETRYDPTDRDRPSRWAAGGPGRNELARVFLNVQYASGARDVTVELAGGEIQLSIGPEETLEDAVRMALEAEAAEARAAAATDTVADPETEVEPEPERHTPDGRLRIVDDATRDTDLRETFEELDGFRLGDAVKIDRVKSPGEVRRIFIVDGRHRAEIFVPEPTREHPNGHVTLRDLDKLTVAVPTLNPEAKAALETHPSLLEEIKRTRQAFGELLGREVHGDERNQVMADFRAAVIAAKNNLQALPPESRAELRAAIDALADTSTLQAAPDATGTVPTPPDPPQPSPWLDVRLKRSGFRASLSNMAGELTPNGGMTYIRDEHDRIIGRTPSVNPDWFKSLNETDETRMSVRKVQKAVEKAITGKKLGIREQRVVQAMLDDVTGQRAEVVDYAREELEAAREQRRQARAAAGLASHPDLDLAGELYDELEYDPEMGGPARVIFELMEEASREGVPEALLERLAIQYDDNLALITALESAIHEQRNQTGTEAVPAQPQARATPAPEGAGDLFGDDRAREQELADEIRRRDDARNRGQESIETGDPSDLFSEATRQQDLEQVTRAKPPADTPLPIVRKLQKKLTEIQAAAYKLALDMPQPFQAGDFMGQPTPGSGKVGTANQAITRGHVTVNTILQLEAKGYLEVVAKPDGPPGDWTLRAIPEGAAEGPTAYTDSDFREDLDAYLREEPVEPQAGASELELAKREAVQAVADLGSAPGVFAETASRELARRRSTSLVGQTLSSVEDLAIAAQVYRDPRFETLRFIFTDANDAVIAQVGISARLPASAAAVVGDNATVFYQELQHRAEAEGAAGYFMLHNHPSGASQPSDSDRRLTQQVANIGLPKLRYRGHVVVNHNNWSEIDAQGEYQIHTERLTPEDFRRPGDSAQSPRGDMNPGREIITGPASVRDFARARELGADNEISLIVADQRHVILGVHGLPVEALKGQPPHIVRRRLLRAALGIRGARIFAVGRDLNVLMALDGMVVDAVHLEDAADGSTRMRSLRESQPMQYARSEDVFPARRMSRISPDTSPAFDYLRPLARHEGQHPRIRMHSAPHELAIKMARQSREYEGQKRAQEALRREEQQGARRRRLQRERETQAGQGRLPGVEEDRGPYERRQDPDRRERIAAMSTEEIINELYTDPLTGLANRRAFIEEAADFPVIASVDADALKFINDNLSPDAGDAMLIAIGEALDQPGVEAYHFSGDEFYVAGDTEADVLGAIELAKGILANQVISSAKGRVKGIGVTYGLGHDKASADAKMKAEKVRRGEAGKRPRRGSDPPSGFTLSVLANRPLDMQAGSNYVGIIGQRGRLPVDANNQLVLGNGRKVRIPEKPIRREHILALMQRAFGNRIYSGRVKGSMRLGFYRPGHGEIRIKNANDIEVAGHELAHWLDDRYPWIERLYKNNRTVQDEIKSVSYDIEKVFEGYAEFMRLFFTQDNEAQARAPGFYDLWIKALNERPKLRDAIFDIQELMHAWMQQGARARLASKHGTTDASIFEKMRRLLPKDSFLQSALDGLRGLKQAELDITDGASTTAYNKLRIALGGSNGVLEALMFWGTPGFRADGQGFEFTGEGISQAFGKLWGEEDMALYMLAKRGEELMGQGRENLLRADEIAAGLQIGIDRPEIPAAFERWLALNQRMLQFAEDSGILGADVRALIEEANKSYVPFHRIVESEIEGKRVKGGGNPFMRLTGGTQNVNVVWENILNNYGLIIRMALVNDGKRAFYKIVEGTQGSLRRNTGNQKAALYAAPIGKDTKPVKIQSDQVLRKVLEAMGISMQQYAAAKEGFVESEAELVMVEMIDRMVAGLGQMTTFFKTGVDPTGTVDYYLHQGRSKFFEIGDPGLWDSIQYMGPKATNLVLNILGAFTSTLRRGVVAVPVFQSKNFIRDTANAWLLSDHIKVPAARALKAAFSRMHRDPAYQEMLLNGGGFANRAQGLQAQRKLVINPTRLTAIYDRFMGRFENANRLAEFKASRAAGHGPRHSALLSRDISTDFAMRGSSQTARVLAIAVPFLNARAQGNYRVARQFTARDRAVSYAVRGTALMAATLALYALNRDDERYKEMPEDIKDLYWIFFTGEGEDDYFLLPKPFESGMLWGTIPERLMEYTRTENGKELADALLWMFLETFNMDMVPQAFSPWRDLMRNKNFAGSPVVPHYLENVEPSEQFSYYTSESVRELAQALGLSPLKTEHVIRGYLGTMGTYAIAASDAMMRATVELEYGEDPTRGESWRENILVRAIIDPLVSEGPPRRTKYVQDLYDMVREAERVAQTAALMQKRQSDQLEAYVEDPENQVQLAINPALQAVREQLNELRRNMDLVRQSKDLTGDEKRAEIWTLTRQRNALVYQAVSEIALAKRDAEEQVKRSQQEAAAGAQ